MPRCRRGSGAAVGDSGAAAVRNGAPSAYCGPDASAEVSGNSLPRTDGAADSPAVSGDPASPRDEASAMSSSTALRLFQYSCGGTFCSSRTLRGVLGWRRVGTREWR